MNISNEMKHPVFGCYEVDAIGTILYTRVEADGIFGNPQASVIGQNFFDEVVPNSNIDEFRGLFKGFLNSREKAAKFTFNYRFEDCEVQAKVMLTQINEREFDGHRQLIFVDLRKV